MSQRSRVSRQIKQRDFIHIYSNGDTEVNYFNLKKEELGIKNVIIKSFRKNAGNPKELMKIIAREENSRGICLRDIREDDRIYCVIDVDETSDKNLEEALQLKEAKYIKLILSNPNFELWVLLHFRQYTSQLSIGDTLVKLLDHIPYYEKPKIKPIFPLLRDKEINAITNAKKLKEKYLDSRTNLYSRSANPYTSIFEIIEVLNSLT